MRRLLTIVTLLALLAPGAAAQMPDPRQMSGVPLPTGEIPAGTVTVRVVRGTLTNVVTGHPVELIVGASTVAGKTNEQGRVEFTGLAIGARVKAVTTVDGQRLESQEISLPPNAGVRYMLVATDDSAAPGAQPGATPPTEDQQAAARPAQPGMVVLGEQSRFVIELGDEGLNVFNIFEIQNTSSAPVQPATPIVFSMPEGAEHVALLEGSSPLAVAAGDRVTVNGPFPPGMSLVQFAYTLPYSGGSATITQRLPAGLARLSVAAQKVGPMTMTSPQITQQRDMNAEGQTYMVGQGPPLETGSDLSISFTGLPHAPLWPRNLALALAGFVLLAGAYGAARGRQGRGATIQRERLVAERERLFAELTALEEAHRLGTADPTVYDARRRELVVALERVYAALDEEVAA